MEFVDTVGRLYYQNSNHKNMADKKITYFLDFIRSHFYIKKTHFTDELNEIVSEKSGIELQEIQILFQNIQKMQRQTKITEKELSRLNHLIDQFYNNVSST